MDICKFSGEKIVFVMQKEIFYIKKWQFCVFYFTKMLSALTVIGSFMVLASCNIIRKVMNMGRRILASRFIILGGKSKHRLQRGNKTAKNDVIVCGKFGYIKKI